MNAQPSQARSSFDRKLTCDATGRPHRHGYSLLELMIVLAILVSVMAVAWPRITRRLQLIGPREAALQVKADLAEARESAILSGEAWVLRIECGGVQYLFGPVDDVRDSMRSNSLSTDNGLALHEGFDSALQAPAASPEFRGVEAQTATRSDGSVHRSELPAGMVFDDEFAYQADNANSLRDATARSNRTAPNPTFEMPSRESSAVGPTFELQTSPSIDGLAIEPQYWKTAIIFQPDGRATEAEIRLKDRETENTIQLRIRGFTGGVSIDRMERKRPDATQLDDGNSIEASPQTELPSGIPYTSTNLNAP